MKYRNRKKIAYFLKARHRGGHGIHSPFLYRLITSVIENRGFYSAYTILKDAEVNVRNMLKIQDLEFFQPVSQEASEFSPSDIRRMHLLPVRYDLLLFRLVNEFAPAGISYFGSNFGVTLLALALADSRIKVMAQLENDHYRSFCTRLTEVYQVENILLQVNGKAEAADFLVIQHPEDPDHCKRLLAEIFSLPDWVGTIILCGIHWSAGMECLWLEFQKESAVRISLDLFEVGIFICRKGLQKEDFVLRF